ncbi:MAG: hypothetical protein K2J83_05580 [Clostridia bacterium]|nr:hypothetical protein [Clostridia bacterium]
MTSAEEKAYTEEDIRNRIKPLSQNGFVRFFQNIVRRWLGMWYGFAEKKPRLAYWIYKVGFFCAFSISVTLWQFIIMTFLPYAFESLNRGAAGWPMIPIPSAGGRNFTIFGDENGWGYFIAFEIAVFTAQCINFPLQRNITYKSHGNPWLQAMWYFIGWVLVSVGTNALWGVCNAYLLHWGSPHVLNGLIKTLITGLVSLIVFFFIFMIIFPDNDKAASRAKAKYEKLVGAGASAERLEKAEQKMNRWKEKADLYNAEKEESRLKSLASTQAIKYFAFAKALDSAEEKLEKLKEGVAPEDKIFKAESKVISCREKKAKSFADAVEAAGKVKKYGA